MINPHYGKYYEDGSNYPADYISPVPVKLLAVAGGVRFRIRLASRDAELLDKTRDALKQRMELFGLGAKTRRGYGLFQVGEVEDDKQ